MTVLDRTPEVPTDLDDDEVTAFALGDPDDIAPPIENLALDAEDTTPAGDREANLDPDDPDDLAAFDSRRTLEHDTGDLYGVVTQQASDIALTATEAEDGFVGADRGQNWFEALQASAAEGGVLPEHAIDVEDELDRPGAGHSRKDRPIADAGVGGPAGR